MGVPLIPIVLTLLILPQQIARHAPLPLPPAQAERASADIPQLRGAHQAEEYSSSQVTFFSGADGNSDGRVDVMHFQDGKTAITAGKDWRCSYVNDPVQHRLAIVCDIAGGK